MSRHRSAGRVEEDNEVLDGAVPTETPALASWPGTQEFEEGIGWVSDGLQTELEPPGKCRQANQLPLAELGVVLGGEGVMRRLLFLKAGHAVLDLLDRLVQRRQGSSQVTPADLPAWLALAWGVASLVEGRPL